MSLADILKDSKAKLTALLEYANGKTNANDVNIGDAIRTLVDGFGSGGTGCNINAIKKVTIPEDRTIIGFHDDFLNGLTHFALYSETALRISSIQGRICMFLSLAGDDTLTQVYSNSSTTAYAVGKSSNSAYKYQIKNGTIEAGANVSPAAATSYVMLSGDWYLINLDAISDGGVSEPKGKVLLAEFETVGDNTYDYPLDFIMPARLEMEIEDPVGMAGTNGIWGNFNSSLNPTSTSNMQLYFGSGLATPNTYYSILNDFGGTYSVSWGFNGNIGTNYQRSTSIKAGTQITKMKIAVQNSGFTIHAGCKVRIYGWYA